ncbi:MAG: hypothetical protein FP820_09075 [Sulfurimonas sp.]|nr:hypothetical protein [Sulfurimonas sp.]MBU3938340.1 hypothetical protein [bacterium]MBU4025142.1 hypothetical protein [bacterium]MBU4057934.1 hypothetical protein [bacterium]MBU4109378.1 hypothetical protein [bacterium]
MWNKALQIAIVEKNADKIKELLDTPSNFATLEEVQEARYLLAEASELMHELKDDTARTMKQIKKNIDFLSSTQAKKSNKLDIKS